MSILKKFKAGETYILPMSEVEKFSLHPCNRKIYDSNVKAIMKEVVKDADRFTKINPIKVGIHTGNVLDGQHTREAYLRLAKKGRIPSDTRVGVVFVDVAPEDELDLIQTLNSVVKKWTVGDFVQSEVNAGKPTFMALDELIRRVPALYDGKGKKKYRIATAALCGRAYNLEDMRSGKFVADESQIDEAVRVSEEVLWILDCTMSKPSALADMTAHWFNIRGDYPFSEWKAAFRYKKQRIKNLPKDTGSQWKNILNEIYAHIGTMRRKSA